MPERDLDLVLYGATSFTGRLVADYLSTSGPPDLRWAIAGRSRAKLTAIQAELSAAAPDREVELIVADSGDSESLAAMVSRARVVCSTVGPYLTYGLPLVEQCVEQGVGYCDLTGEVPFMRQSIDRFHERAAETGARIVHACGYDSIPGDLGAWMVQQAMTERGQPATRVVTYVGPSKGGASGGTIASGIESLKLAGADPAVRRMAADPYSLDPEGSPKGPRDWDPRGPAHAAEIDQWTAPFLMGFINTRVVRRSHALLGHPWSTDFSYQEVMAVGAGLKGRARATAVSVAMGAAFGALTRPSLRGLIEKRLPQPGEGPDEETRESGYFRHLIVAEGPGGRLLGRVIGTKDPGYGGTAIMLGEAALCLAFDGDQTPDRAGVLTPATALAGPLLERLRAAGMTWSVEDWPDDGVPRP